MNHHPRPCEARSQDGRPCRAWAVRAITDLMRVQRSLPPADDRRPSPAEINAIVEQLAIEKGWSSLMPKHLRPQRPAPSYQPPATSDQPPATSYQPPATTYQPRAQVPLSSPQFPRPRRDQDVDQPTPLTPLTPTSEK